MTKSTTSALFADDESGPASPWDLPTPRKQQTRADLIRSLLPSSDVPDSYIAAFDAVVRDDGSDNRVTSGGLARTLAAARLSADDQARIMGILAPRGSSENVSLDRNEFNVLLALVGLAQEGEGVTLDSVDERRHRECHLLPVQSPPSYLICVASVAPSRSRVVDLEVGPLGHRS